MFRLRLFGTPQLEGPAGLIPTPGPRRFALLASLSAAGTAGLTRDKLVARLWSEADDDRAKRNLSQLLYAMRTELGADLVEGTGTIRLDPSTVWCDVAAFDAAVAARDDATALELYRGPFLDGFHLADAPEFSDWADTERDRRSRTARTAAVRAAEQAAQVTSADPHAVSVAWHRAYGLDPLNDKLVLRLLDALDAAGDRAGAIRIAEQYATRVRAELEAEPEPEVVRRAQVLRGAPAGRTSAVAALPAAIAPAASAAPVPIPAHSDAPSPPIRASRRAPRFALGVAGGILGIALVAAWSLRAPAPLDDGEYVILSEFENQTSDSSLTRSVGTAVAASLQQSAHVVSLPRERIAAALRRMERPDTSERLDVESARDVARREGVRFVLAGELVDVAGTRQLISRIVEATSGRVVATHSVRVAGDRDLLDAVDRMAAAMRRDLGEARASVAASIPLPEVTTQSLAALSHYAEGIAAERRDDEPLAANMYRKAVALDSNFASAHALLAALYNRHNDVPKATYHFERAIARVDRLPVGEALRIRVADSFARGDLDGAVRYSKQLVGLRPRDFAAWSRLGFYLFQSGRAKEAREAYAVADSLGPLSATGILNFGSAWAIEARSTSDAALYDSARVRFARAIAMQPSTEYSPYYNQTYGTVLLGAGFPDSARATFVRTAARSQIDRLRALRSLAFLESMEGHWDVAIEDLTEAAELSIASQQWTSALRNYALEADLLLTLGDTRAAAAPLRDATGIALNRPIEARAVAFVALAQVKAGNGAAAARLLDRMRTISRAEHVGEQVANLTVEGAAHLAAGRAAEARTTLETAFKRDPTSNQLPMLLARARAATGADSAAADLWARAAREFGFGFEGQFDWQFAWYELGLVQERMGRREEALASYRRAVAPYAGIATGGGRVPPALAAARARIVVLESQGR